MPKLIMIDDNPMEHLVMQKMFSRYELFRDAEHSFDGEAVMGSLMENRNTPAMLPDLIFLDLHMPEYNGWLFLEDYNMLHPLLKKNINIYVVTSSIKPLEKWRLKAYPFIKGLYIKPVKQVELEMLYRAYRNTDRMAC